MVSKYPGDFTLAIGIAALTMTALPLWAADPTPATEAPSQIEEVIVTAQKVQQSEQSVPITLSAFSAKDLQQEVILKVQDLGEHITGLVVTQNPQGNAPNFSIRATKTGNAVDGGIAVYFDDVPLVNTMPVLGQFFDLSSVETLKGPQGTLFGVNTTGGAISFRAAKPSDKFEGYVDLGIGNYDRKDAEAMINVPVNDVLQLRFAGLSVRREGYVKNLTTGGDQPGLLNDERHDAFRLSARVKPAEGITNDLVYDYFRMRSAGSANIPTAFTPFTSGYANAHNINLSYVNNTSTWNTISTGGNPSGVNLPLYSNGLAWGLQDVLNWDINGNVGIKNVAGYRVDRIESAQDDDGSPINLVNGHDQFNNFEWVDDFTLKLNSDDHRLRVVSGFYISHTDKKHNDTYDLAQIFFPVPINLVTANEFERSFLSRAVYSQAEYDLTKELTVTFGLRYNWDSGNYSAHSYQGYTLPSYGIGPNSGTPCYVPSLVGTVDAASCTGTVKGSWQAPGTNFVISDKFADRSMLYMKFSSGYVQGGFNDSIRETQLQTFDPEKTYTFEAGLKSDWDIAGRPIRTNIDAFYGHSTNKQQNQNGGYKDGTQWQAVFNAGAITFYGTDAEIKYNPLDSLELSATWTRIKAIYDNFVFPSVGTYVSVNLSGSSPAQIPKDSITLGTTYTWPLPANFGKVDTSMTGYYRSKITFQDVANVGNGLPLDGNTGPAYWTANVSTNWSNIFGTHLDANLWLKNAFNKYYIVYYIEQAGLGYAQINRGDPRMFGINLRYNF